MVAPRSRNPLFNRTPNYQRTTQAVAVPPNWYMPRDWHSSGQLPAGMLGQPGAAQNPLRRPADSGVPGAGYDQAAEAAAVLQRMAENPISAAMAPVQPASPKQLISPGNPMAPNSPLKVITPDRSFDGYLNRANPGLLPPAPQPYNSTPRGYEGGTESDQRYRALVDTPRVTSSMQAGMAPMDIPALSNGYSPLPSITEGQAYAQGLPMDRAGQSRRIENQNPMFSGMQSRFGEGGALAPTGDYAQSGGTGWYDRLSTQEKYGYGPTTPGVDGRISSDPRYATGMLPKDKDRPARGTPKDREYLARKYAEQEKRQKDFRDQNGGMSSRQVRRQEQKDRSEAFRFRKAVEGGLNPMSDKAQARFPGAAARFKSGDNPMAVSPFKPDSPNTPENKNARHDARRSVFENSPTLQDWGVDPDADASGFSSSVYSNLTAGNLEDISDEGLQQLFATTKTYGKTDEGKPPFDGQNTLEGNDLLNELWSMPTNTPISTLRKWAERYRSETKSRLGNPSDGMWNVPVGM